MNRRGQDRTGPLGGSGMVGLWGAASVVRSVQYGSITIAAGATTNTATIAAVNTANSVCMFLGVTSSSLSDGQTDPSIYFTRVALTNATTVTATKATTDVTYGKIVNFCVIEFAPGVTRQIQSGVVSFTGTTGTATIVAVDVNKTWLVYGGSTTSYPAASMNTYGVRLSLTNATTVTGDTSSSQTYTAAFMAVEFF